MNIMVVSGMVVVVFVLVLDLWYNFVFFEVFGGIVE